MILSMHTTKNGIRVLVPKASRRGRQCFKIRHPDRASAFDHLVKLEAKDHDFRLTVYRCPFCRMFHVGHEGEEN